MLIGAGVGIEDGDDDFNSDDYAYDDDHVVVWSL